MRMCMNLLELLLLMLLLLAGDDLSSLSFDFLFHQFLSHLQNQQPSTRDEEKTNVQVMF